MKIEKFGDFKVWQYSRTLVNVIYSLTINDAFSKNFGLKEQIQRVSVSIMNNIAEGFERDNNKEFARFLIYSKGSAGEVRSRYICCKGFELYIRNRFSKSVWFSIRYN